MNLSWFPLSIFGAFIYGSFSFSLALVSEKIKNNESVQFGYGILLMIIQIPLVFIIFGIWAYKNKNDYKILVKNLNWKILALTLAFGILINPAHAMVINAGGSIGQQTMYSLAIIPVLIGSWFFFRERLNLQQWSGLILAGIGAFLMSYKNEKETLAFIE